MPKLQSHIRTGWSVSGLFRRLPSLGPYLLVELLLPGGTLIALLMYVYQHKRAGLGLISARVVARDSIGAPRTTRRAPGRANDAR